MRAFGTLPHANILACFLVFGFMAFCYLYLQSRNPINRLCSSIGMFFVGLGLIVSFSRSGWIGAVIGIFLIVFWGLRQEEFRKKAKNLFFIISAVFLLLFGIMSWAIFPRAQFSANEGPVRDRIIYNQIAWKIIQTQPLGVGIGNEVMFATASGLYQMFGLNNYRLWQPTHNLFLLIGAETGITGLVLFLAFLFGIFKRINWKDISGATAGIILICFLVLGLFDHYFWDLESGRLMFWLVLGIIMGLGPRGEMPACR